MQNKVKILMHLKSIEPCESGGRKIIAVHWSPTPLKIPEQFHSFQKEKSD